MKEISSSSGKENRNDVIQYILALILYVLMTAFWLTVLILAPDDRYSQLDEAQYTAQVNE